MNSGWLEELIHRQVTEPQRSARKTFLRALDGAEPGAETDEMRARLPALFCACDKAVQSLRKLHGDVISGVFSERIQSAYRTEPWLDRFEQFMRACVADVGDRCANEFAFVRAVLQRSPRSVSVVYLALGHFQECLAEIVKFYSKCWKEVWRVHCFVAEMKREKDAPLGFWSFADGLLEALLGFCESSLATFMDNYKYAQMEFCGFALDPAASLMSVDFSVLKCVVADVQAYLDAKMRYLYVVERSHFTTWLVDFKAVLPGSDFLQRAADCFWELFCDQEIRTSRIVYDILAKGIRFACDIIADAFRSYEVHVGGDIPLVVICRDVEGMCTCVCENIAAFNKLMRENHKERGAYADGYASDVCDLAAKPSPTTTQVVNGYTAFEDGLFARKSAMYKNCYKDILQTRLKVSKLGSAAEFDQLFPEGVTAEVFMAPKVPKDVEEVEDAAVDESEQKLESDIDPIVSPEPRHSDVVSVVEQKAPKRSKEQILGMLERLVEESARAVTENVRPYIPPVYDKLDLAGKVIIDLYGALRSDYIPTFVRTHKTDLSLHMPLAGAMHIKRMFSHFEEVIKDKFQQYVQQASVNDPSRESMIRIVEYVHDNFEAVLLEGFDADFAHYIDGVGMNTLSPTTQLYQDYHELLKKVCLLIAAVKVSKPHMVFNWEYVDMTYDEKTMERYFDQMGIPSGRVMLCILPSIVWYHDKNDALFPPMVLLS